MAMEKTVSRRGFIGGLTATTAASAIASMSAASAAHASETEQDEVAVQDNVAPVAPLQAPEQWDAEYDVVVAGSGSGLVAAVRAAELGASVAVFEKLGEWGGVSKETDIVAIAGSKYQTQLMEAIDLTEMGMPGVTLADMVDQMMGGHDEATMKGAFLGSYLLNPGSSMAAMRGASNPDGTSTPLVTQGHIETVQALVDTQADMLDWLVGVIGQYGVQLGPVTEYGQTGMMYLCPMGSEAGGLVARANYGIFEALYNAAVAAGVEFSFGNGVAGLVADETGAIVGVQTDEGAYVRAAKGVVLATGGMAANKDMLQRYCPAVANGCFTATTTPADDGLGIRLGLGAGGIMDGFDSANCFDGGLQTDGYIHYLYDGDVQFARNIPSIFNIRGERVPWYSLYSIGFTDQSGILMGQPGGYGIAVTDANYETLMAESTEPICRKPITPEMMAAAGENAARLTLTSGDWHDGFNRGLEGGWIVQADSIEELAEKLGVNAANLQRGIDQWNATCAAGADEMFGLDPALLRPIETAPFYAAKVNGTILNTFCGLACDWRTSAVLDARANPIPGLYASGTTMGGSSGTGSLGSTRNPGGGVGFACGTAFAAANAIMA